MTITEPSGGCERQISTAESKLVAFLHRYARGGSWERDAACRLGQQASVEHIIAALNDPDPNQRIMATMALGFIADVLGNRQNRRAVRSLVPLLADGSLNEFEYGGRQDDEGTPVAVSQVAAESLVVLGYAADVAGVVERARDEGARVCERLFVASCGPCP